MNKFLLSLIACVVIGGLFVPHAYCCLTCGCAEAAGEITEAGDAAVMEEAEEIITEETIIN